MPRQVERARMSRALPDERTDGPGCSERELERPRRDVSKLRRLPGDVARMTGFDPIPDRRWREAVALHVRTRREGARGGPRA